MWPARCFAPAPFRNTCGHHANYIMRNQAAVLSAIVSVCTLSFASTTSGQVLFTDDFDSGQSGLVWTINQGGGTDSSAEFAFNYSLLGIPSAPNSTGGTTIGLRFLVNQEAGVFQGISASPVGQSFTGDFRIRFDLWINSIGPFPGGGDGSTQMASFGWGTSGTTAQWAAAKHSVVFAASGDGGSSQDYRAYLREYQASAGATIDPVTGFYNAGTINDQTANDARNASNGYYASLGGKTAPDAQVLLYPGQTGTTAPGALAFAWRDIIIEKNGNVVSWSIDGLPIASVPITDFAALGGDNIFLGMFDINAASSSDINDLLNAALFDNIRVELIPEPGSTCLLAVATAALCVRRRRRA
jgi:hypothetical protein